MRCKAVNKNGNNCKNISQGDSSFCFTHRSNIDIHKMSFPIIGAVIGNLILPGVGGLIAGASLGGITNKYFKGAFNMKKKVFVSFDFENDRQLKDFIIGQSRLPGSPFEVVDNSLKEAAPENNWEAKANIAILKSDIVLVMVGSETYRAHGVLKEIKMARAANKQIVQIIGYKNRNYTPVTGAGRLYSWSWENLKKLLS